MPALDPGFWQGRRILLTGHTGFKGAWMALCLKHLGAQISGLSLAPDTVPSLYALTGIADLVAEHFVDLRDLAEVTRSVTAAQPEIVFHLAAQPLVRRSIREPVLTFATNMMGTVHLLEALRRSEGLKAILVVTTDKVYGGATERPFRESDPLGAHDPYSSSKAAAELVVSSYAQTYFVVRRIPVATARGGNVIGGGDFSADRLVPDIYYAMVAGKPLVLRNPRATRPWQYVLDCVLGYLTYAQALIQREDVPRALNFAPSQVDQIPVVRLADAMQVAMGISPSSVAANESSEPSEVQELMLDATLAREQLGWAARYDGLRAITATADWYLALRRGEDMRAYTRRLIQEQVPL